MKIKYLTCLLIVGNALSYCDEPCQRYNVSWLGCGWPNLLNRACRKIDAFGREGRYYTSLAEGFYSGVYTGEYL